MARPKSVESKIAGVERELRAFIEAGLESGELVLDDGWYGFTFEAKGAQEVVAVLRSPRDDNAVCTRFCSACLLGCAVRSALRRGHTPTAFDAFGVTNNINHDLGASALGIGVYEAQAMERGFMGINPRPRGALQPWFDLGARLRADYYVDDVSYDDYDALPRVTNVYIPEMLG